MDLVAFRKRDRGLRRKGERNREKRESKGKRRIGEKDRLPRYIGRVKPECLICDGKLG